MTTSTENLNTLLASYTELKDYYEGQRGAWDDGVVQAKAEYDDLASDLRTLIGHEMYFAGVVDPDEVNPNNLRGGTFSSLQDAIHAAPYGSFVRLLLLSGKTYTIPSVITCANRTIQFIKSGAGDNPIIEIGFEVIAGANEIRAFHHMGATFTFQGIDVQLPTALADDTLPVGSRRSFLGYSVGLPVIASFQEGTITGGLAGTDIGLSSCHGSSQCNIGLHQIVLDGPFYVVNHATRGNALIQTQLVTIVNGAALSNGGAIGTNILQN